MRKIFKDFSVEIIIFIIALVMLFLLFEPFGIKDNLLEWTGGFFTGLGSLVIQQTGNLAEWYSSVSTGNLLVLIGIMAVIVLLLFRIRSRILHSPSWRMTVCPKCHSPLYRAKRSSFDHFIARTFLPHARRYICSNEDCRWSGLRHHIHRKHRADSKTAKPSSG